MGNITLLNCQNKLAKTCRIPFKFRYFLPAVTLITFYTALVLMSSKHIARFYGNQNIRLMNDSKQLKVRNTSETAGEKRSRT